MEQTFAGQIAIVTGAASGIGQTVAGWFADRGAAVVGVDLSDNVHDVVAGLDGDGSSGAQHLAITADLTDPAAGQRVVEQTVEQVGTPTILINSAGVALLDPALDVPAERWQTTMDINLSGTFYMAQAAGRAMVDAGYGRIINLASQAAVIGLDQHAAYCASKAAVVGLTHVLSMEWAPSGVTVNAVSPTVVETPLGKKAWAGERGEKAKAAIPAGRFAQPEEVAALIGFLAGKDAAMITGSNYIIDGGFTTV